MCGSEINDEQECVRSLEVYSISENTVDEADTIDISSVGVN